MCYYMYELKNVSQIFKILFQPGDINIFVLRGVSFLVVLFNSKAPFLTKKTAVKSETHFSEKLSKINVAKY